MDSKYNEQLIFLQTLLESIPGPVFYKGTDFKYLGCNQAFCDFLGFSRETIVGHTADEFCPAELAAVYREADEKLFNNPGVQVYEAEVKYADGSNHDVIFHKATFNDSQGQVAGFIGVILDITKRKLAEDEVRMQKQILQQTLDSLKEGILRLDLEACVMESNAAAQILLEYCSDELRGMRLTDLHPDGPSRETAQVSFQMMLTTPESLVPFEGFMLMQSGKEIMTENTLIPLLDGEGNIQECLYVVRDISQQKKAELERIQVQKLQSIGQLAAGIAHEINTPAQYITDNTKFLAEAISCMEFIFQLPKGIIDGQGMLPMPLEQLRDRLQSCDFDYLVKEIPLAISQTQDGIQHIATIVRALKEFSHPGGSDRVSSDLNRIIDNAVIISKNEWKYVADLNTDFDLGLPPVECLPDQISQVILNLIVNAAQAIKEKQDSENNQAKGVITVTTRKNGQFAEICISDTGSGISDHIHDRVYDPFFTTKDVGEGTGQGLAIAHDIICDKHHGKIRFESQVGQGAKFYIQLPIV